MASVETSGIDPQALRANKLELVERLADDLAHEIKNPLHSMVINLEVLRRRVERLSVEEKGDLLRFAGVVAGELDRATRRIEMLLRLVRPDRSGEPATLPELIEEFVELLELERERHAVTLEFQPAPQPLRGRVPREPGRQLILNLLLTALDATSRGGRILITTEPAPGEMRLIVSAIPAHAELSGAGAESSRVALVRALSEGLGGQLAIQGDGGDQGFQFRVSLPAAAE